MCAAPELETIETAGPEETTPTSKFYYSKDN